MKKLIFLLVLCSLVLGGVKLYSLFTRGTAMADAAVAEFHARLDAAKDDEIYDTAASALRSSVKKDGFHKFLDQLRAQAMEVELLGPAAYRTFLMTELDKWSALVKASGAKVD